MRPTIVCHMMSSIDGRLNGDRWSEPFDGKNRDILFAPYYTISERLSPEAHMLGRNTVQIHFCPKTFDHTGLPRAVRPEPYLALSPAPRKLVILDPHGKIFYDTNTIMDSGIIAVPSENCPLTPDGTVISPNNTVPSNRFATFPAPSGCCLKFP